MFAVPTRQDYQPDIDAASDAFRADLQRILCKPGKCRCARPERCPAGRAALAEGEVS